MVRFLAHRAGSLVVVVCSLLVLVFALSRVGGDPVRAYLGPNASQSAVAETRARLGLDQPLPAQFIDYVLRLVNGDLGISYSTRRPVVEELAVRIPATVELALWAVIFAVLIAIALSGLYTLRGRGAGIVRFVLFSAASAPSFLLATGGVLLFFAVLGALPASGRSSFGASQGLTGFYVLDGLIAGSPAYSWDAALHLILPALAASIGPGVALARVLADGLSGAMTSPYARTARSLGEGERTILVRHGFRNAASPALSMLGVQIGMMLSSLVVVEQIFSWNGLGQYLTRAISAADVNSIAAVSLILGVFYVVMNAVVDIVLAAVDPRIRLT